MNNVTYTIFTSLTPTTKKYTLVEGKIHKQANAAMYEGTADRVTLPFEGFAQALSEATENEAFGYGLHSSAYPNEVGIVVVGKEQPDNNIISRSKEYFDYLVEPGVLMIDHDPSEYGPVISQDELMDVLIKIHPAIGEAARIIRGSVSAGVHLTGEQPSTIGKGFHIYIPVTSAEDIPRYGKLLSERLWVAGFGYIALSANGKLLERTVIDGAVFSPERLDFVSKPVLLDDVLEYAPPEITYIDGGLLDTETLPKMTKNEKALVNQLKFDAKEAVAPVATMKQEQWAEAKAKEMLAQGLSIIEAHELINQILSDECHDLYADFPLEFATGTFSVAQVLANPGDFDGKALADPIEGNSYGSTTAKFYWNNGVKPVINSFAHGQDTKYFLHQQAPLEAVNTSTYNDVLDGEQKYYCADLLQYLEDDHVLKRLSKQVANETKLPVNTVFLIGLAVYSSMSARVWCVQYPNGKTLPIGLYVSVEQPSGASKSWCVAIFQGPFFEAQTDAINSIKDRIKELEKITSPSIDDQLELERLKVHPAHLFTTNTTPEGLEKTLLHSNGFFSAVSSEQGLFDSLLGLCYGNGVNNNDLVLNGFDAGYFSSTRVSRKGYVGKVVGGVVCFAQPGSIEKVLTASNATGLSERFLMLAEAHSLGSRDHLKIIKSDEAITLRYTQSCSFTSPAIVSPLSFDELIPLEISKEGFQLIATYRNTIEPHLADGGKYSHVSLRGAASKINMQIMKIAANLHMLRPGWVGCSTTINDEYIIAAINIAGALLEANLTLCIAKGIIGQKASFTAAINYLTKTQNFPRTDRELVNSLRTTKPFKDLEGNKAGFIRETLSDMVDQGVLVVDENGKYSML